MENISLNLNYDRTEVESQIASGERWYRFAHCVGQNSIYFITPSYETPRAKKGRETRAVNICLNCPVRSECLDEAMELEDHGEVRAALLPSQLNKLQLAQRQKIARQARNVRP